MMIDVNNLSVDDVCYLIIRNEHGWTLEPMHWVPKYRTPPMNMKSFSRLSQLVWHLTRVHANDNSGQQP
jgi:hypothetical protein